MYTRIYNFYNIVKIKIVSRHKQYIKYFDDEYQDIEVVRDLDDQKIDITFRLDLGFPEDYEKENSFFHKLRFKKIFPVTYLITDIEKEHTQVYVKGNFSIFFYPFIMGSFLLSEVIDILLYLKFLLKNHIVLHSACIADDKKGYVFAAFGGSGKTSLALEFISKGMVFLNDDKTIISDTGIIYAYPRLIRLYKYNLKQTKRINDNLKLKFLILFKECIRYPLQKILNTHLYFATRTHIKEIFPEVKIGKTYPLGKMIFIQKGEKLQNKEYMVSDENNNSAIRHIASLILESCEINSILMKRVLSRKPDFSEFLRKKEIELLFTIFDKLESIHVIKEYTISSQNVDKFVSLLKSP